MLVKPALSSCCVASEVLLAENGPERTTKNSPFGLRLGTTTEDRPRASIFFASSCARSSSWNLPIHKYVAPVAFRKAAVAPWLNARYRFGGLAAVDLTASGVDCTGGLFIGALAGGAGLGVTSAVWLVDGAISLWGEASGGFLQFS